MNKFENDLSKGSVVKQLVLFSLPFLISNLIQSLYNVADMVIVGQFSGTVSMSGVNIGGQVTMLVTNLVVGLGAGATVLIAQYLGANEKELLKKTIGTLMTTLLVLAVAITILMLALQVPILKAIRTPAESFQEARVYLLITALGTIFILGYNALSAVMRGLGDSKRPLYFVGIACAVNVFLDLLFVAVMGLGAAGAGIATIISQGISMCLCIIYLKRNNFIFDFTLKSFKFDKQQLRMLLKIGVPTSVQNVITGISFLILTAMVNTLGVTASAAVGAVGKFNGFAILPAIAMSSSISAMSAQNIGAGMEKRAVETFRAGMVIAAGISFTIFIIAQVFPAQILRVFADDAELIKAGVPYLRAFSYDYLLVPVVFSLTGLFIGAGHTAFSLISAMISSVLVRVPAAYILGISMNMGLVGVGLGAPIASGMALLLGIWFYFSGRWKRLTIITK